ncbi:MAG TPA: hypothetical protein VGJ82_13920, partial [Thermoanaerobaculia bacterium]
MNRQLAIFALFTALCATSATAAPVDLRATLTPLPTIRAGETKPWNLAVSETHIANIDWHLSFPIPANTSFVSLVPLNGLGDSEIP